MRYKEKGRCYDCGIIELEKRRCPKCTVQQRKRKKRYIERLKDKKICTHCAKPLLQHRVEAGFVTCGWCAEYETATRRDRGLWKY